MKDLLLSSSTSSYLKLSLISSLGICLLFTSCGDYRGASEPYSYAPSTPQSIWIPPKGLKAKPINLVEPVSEKLEEQDLSLAEIIDIALTNNPDTQQSWAEARAASAEYGQALQKYYVLSELDGNFERARFGTPPISGFTTSSTGSIFYQSNYGADLALTYTILDFGQTRATSKAALESLYSANFSHNWELQTVVRTIMNDFYTFLSRKAQLAAANQDVVNAQVSLDAVLEKLSQGTTDIADKVQATTTYLQQKLNVVKQKQLLTNAYTILLEDMGIPSNASLKFEDYPDELQLYEIISIEQLIDIAKLHRPDLQSSLAAVRSQEQNLLLAQRKKYPTVMGDFDIGRTYYSGGFNDKYDFVGTVSLKFPLFQGYYIDNGIRLAKANLETSKAQLKELELKLIQEVTSYHQNVGYAREAYQYAKEYLASAQEDFRLYLQKYKVGTTTIVDLINAQTSVANAQSQLVEAEKDWYTSLANIAYATGVLTQKPEIINDAPAIPEVRGCTSEEKSTP